MNELQRRAATLEAEIAQVKSQWPKHSVPPALIMQLEDLEDELEAVQAALKAQTDDAANA